MKLFPVLGASWALIALLGACTLPVNLAAQSSQMPPFFDTVQNPVQVRFPRNRPVDVTPPPPQLNGFDQAVLAACGPFGSAVPASRFRKLLQDHPQVLSQVQQAVGGELRPGRRSREAFLDDLTRAWSQRRGFAHIFCGEPKEDGQVGGLHYVGRYWQLQQQGQGGRLPNNTQREEVIPGAVYTVGVVIRAGDRTYTDTIKGYPYPSNAQEILMDATRLFKAQGNREGACTANIQDRDSRAGFSAVFVGNGSAIVTYYPDATPRGNACRSR